MVQEIPTQATVHLPRPLAEKAAEIAARQRWSFDEAVLFLVTRGLAEQQQTEAALTTAYNRFLESDEGARDEAGKDLIRTIFGPKSVA